MWQFCDNWWHIRAAKMVRMWRSIQNIISGPTHCPNRTRLRCCLKPIITGHHRTSSDFKKGSSMVSSKRKDSSLQLYHARTENFKKSGYLTKKWLFHEKVYVYSKSEYCMKKWFLKEVAICILEHTNLMIIGPFHNNYEIYFSSIGVTPWFRVYIPWTKCSCNSPQSEWTVVWSKSWVRFVRIIWLDHCQLLEKGFFIE